MIQQQYANAAGDGITVLGTGALAATELLPPPPAGWRYCDVDLVMALRGGTGNQSLRLTTDLGTDVGPALLSGSGVVAVAAQCVLHRLPAGRGLHAVTSASVGAYSVHVGRALLVRAT